MDRAIADSHSSVTISHNVISRHRSLKERNTDLSALSWTEGAQVGLLVLFWHEGMAWEQDPKSVL
ncbi:hypothetical protein YWIDRAFT_03378 [Streptomyces sp. SceaMP-e96]|nr:hypothetical protein YWIDRAFT_03378 [Streptomyces sp. SceaMP-e96]